MSGKLRLIWFVLVCFRSGDSLSVEMQGPHFLIEPPHRVDFSNSSGAKIDCSAHSSPPSKIDWVLGDGSPVNKISELREVLNNGTLVFPPFPPELYRHDVHNVVYRCRASNPLGIIISKDVHLRAVVKQKYEVQVSDEYVISGNTAVLRCQVPSYAAEFTIVTSWIQEGVINIYPNTDTGGKFSVMSNGDLYVYKTSQSDRFKTYGCRTVHKLTGDVRASTYPGRIIITEPKGAVQPRIRVEKHSRKQVKYGEDISLPCLAQGYPIPTYRWFREESEKLTPIVANERIHVNPSGLLHIIKSRVEDKGKYICKINNTVGEEVAQVTLSVTAPLSVHIHPQSQVVDVGKEAYLQCTPNGFPVSRVFWFHNGQPLSSDSNYKVISNQILNISSVSKDHQGMYQCFVSNDWDMAQAVAELQLGDASPELTYSFSEQTLQPGPPISLKCVATGNPPPQFTWLLDGFPIPDSSRFLVGQYVTIHDDVVSHVNISSVKVEDGGEYSCIAKNTVTEISHRARINVYGPPFIRVMPKITAVAGNDLIVKCPVAGYPIETITWERDGTILPTNRRQRVYSNGTLIIEQAQRLTDVGTYTCQAQSRQKHSARRDVEVQVLLPPKILPIQAMTNLLREGMRAAISCQVLEGDLPLAFRWQRNGRDDIGSGTTVRRLDEYSTALVIDKIAATHSANYTCIVENVAGSESFTVPLTVNVPPRWTLEPSDTNVVLGYDITLDCQADGYPRPTIMWRKAVGDHPGEYKDFLYEPNINFYRNGSLEFLRITKESEGHYLCEAKNGIANGVSKVIFLKVNSPANFPQKSKQIHVEKGGQAHLQCTALGDNPIQIMWKVGPQRIGEDFDPRYSIREQLLDEGMVSELGISHVFRQDTGVLSCYATNSYGHDEMTIHLIVQEPPELPKNIRIVDQQSRTIQLSWTQPYAGNSPISSYIIQYKLVSEPWEVQLSKVVVQGTQTVATINNLHPATSYHLRILAENKLGMSEPSEVIQITTQEEVPSGPPRDVRVETKSSTELFVQWEPPAREYWNGNLVGYHIGYTKMGNGGGNAMQVKTVDINSQYGGQAVLDNLDMFTSYSIVVNAFNSRGPGPNSESFIAQTKEGVPTSPPEKVNCATISSSALEVWWDLPAPDGRNGHIQGYKVNYYPAEEWYESADVEVKSTSASKKTTLTDLHKFTNYSISVLAFTKTGDGVLSTPIFCQTAEDVPSAPEDIKVLMSSANHALVSWLSPEQLNGELTGYTFYMGMVENGKEGGSHKHVLTPSKRQHEIKVQTGVTYQFWVTASTKVGEGSSTRVVTISPTNKIPARIVSFSQEFHTPWKQNVTLECISAGVPSPKVSWKYHGKLVASNSNRLTVKNDGALMIRDIQYSDRGNYSCYAENQHGEDSIIYNVFVKIPPEPPVLTVVNIESDSLHVKWSTEGNQEVPVLGYIINYKREHGDWEELQINAKEASHILQNLWCGTRYQLYITAFNKIGTGLPCDIVNASTKGAVPVKPTTSQLLTFNSSAITVWLDVWGDGGCEVLYFILEYREESRTDWTLVSNHVKAVDRVYTINDLHPATRYFIRVTAHNNAGSNVGVYNVTTLSTDGTPILPKALPSPDSKSGEETFLNMKIVWTITFVILPLISIGMGCLYLRKRKEDIHCGMGESPSVAQMQNQQNRDQQYAVHSGPTHASHSVDSTYKTDSTEYIEDVCPYATFQLTKPPYPESTFSGNVYSGPYHSVRGSFVYHDLPSSADTYKGRHSKEPEYTKVRRKPTRLRDPHSESQESDNLGSTDSEVKKILTLHLPISEYDTHGSDSDIDGRPMTASQDIISYRHRLSRDMSKGGEESSSSSERSPTGARIQCPHNRKVKMKVQSNKKTMKNNGYSNHTEETSFSFNDRMNQACRFPDPRCHPRDLEELENDIANLGLRRSSRGSVAAPYRLSRESTFQIDV